MIFKIGPSAYRVKVTDRPLINTQGKECYGLCEWVTHTIWISGTVPVRRRLEILVHELRHAWIFEFGKPRDAEDDAVQVGTFCIDVMRQINRIGGEAALMRLTSQGVVDQNTDVGIAADSRHPQCPGCGGYLELPITDGPPMFEPFSPKLLMWRSASCQFCNHEVTWPEACSSSGKPMGAVLGKPVIRPCVSPVASP